MSNHLPTQFVAAMQMELCKFLQASVNCSHWTLEIQSPIGTVFTNDPNANGTVIHANGDTVILNYLPVGVYAAVVTDTCNGNCQTTSFFPISTACPGCGCIDPNALNYDPSAQFDDGSCLYPGGNCGCTDPTATNYNAAALCDDGSCLYDVIEPPCIPTHFQDLIDKSQLCAAKRGYSFLNKIRVGQDDSCSEMDTWKVILMEYLLSKVGNNCIYNCADDDTTPLNSLQTCGHLWKEGGWFTGENHNSLVPGFEHLQIILLGELM